jgi:hypothetical protein
VFFRGNRRVGRLQDKDKKREGAFVFQDANWHDNLRVLSRYAKHNANFFLVVSGSLKAKRTKKVVEIVYDLLIKAIELGSFLLLEFRVRPVGPK